MEDLWYLIPVGLVLVIGWVTIWGLRHPVTVFEEQFAIHWKGGKYLGELQPGRTVLWGGGRRVFTIDKRLRHELLTGQEMMSSDGGLIRASLLAAYYVVDPKVHFDASSESYLGPRDGGCYTVPYEPTHSIAHEATHSALREAITKRTMEECLQQRAEVAKEIAAGVEQDFAGTGLKLERIVIRDLGVSGEIRKAMGELHVAVFQAKANLERARAEAAVMRSLANTARTLESNPAIVQMKLLQAIESGKAQVVIGADALKIADRKTGSIPLEAEE